jgi:hypothetical protein
MKMRRLGWLGHVIKVDETKVAEKTSESKTESRRKARKPRLKWLEDVENDFREL